MTFNAIKVFSFSSLLLLSACCGIDMKELEVMENPFGNKMDVEVESSRGTDSHNIFDSFNQDIQKNQVEGRKKERLKLSYNVLNHNDDMDSFYGYVMYAPVYASLGTFCLTGWPIDFMSQSINMKADLYDKKGAFVKRYTGEGYSFKTVACYYGYTATDARKLANALAFNEALEEIYDQIEEDHEIMNSKRLSSDDYDEIIEQLLEEFEEHDVYEENNEVVVFVKKIEVDSPLVEDELFYKKLRTGFSNMKKVSITTLSEDEMVKDVRDLRKSKEVNQKNIAKENSLVAPKISVQSAIIVREDDGDVEYFFYITLTDLKTGIILVELEESIEK